MFITLDLFTFVEESKSLGKVMGEKKQHFVLMCYA